MKQSSGPVNAKEAASPPFHAHRPGENLLITRGAIVARTAAINVPPDPAPGWVHALAEPARAIHRVIHNFSPGRPRDVVLG